MDGRSGLHLLRTDDRGDVVGAFTDAFGERVGLRGLLGDLNRDADVVRVPARAATWGFRWDEDDQRSEQWWPQGITTSADAGDPEDFEGRTVLVTSAYAKPVKGVAQGSRLTFVDLTDQDRVRYRHVLLVEPYIDGAGAVAVRPVLLHAGGIVWHGDHVHVAGTARGFSSFRLDDVVAVRRSHHRVFGYRYVLPVRFTYDAHAGAGRERLRYSFASVDRSTTPHALVAGEYGRGTATTRLVRYDIDPATSLLHADHDGRSHPRLLDQGIRGMQGATVVRGTWYVTTSRGRFRTGSVWVGRPGHLTEHAHTLPVGPEDIAYWPSRDELWSLSEYPGARYVFAMPRGRFG
ncbi:MAG: hypothetical protein HOQ22_00245 [Nocardioidaceae bacterium]|nr:hypothetical protein [Nocardioidaceae bacterium]NUS49457.1 hypothetical protein [Nocardioidaceae bacterium]